MSTHSRGRNALLVSTALTVAGAIPAQVHAQDAVEDSVGLEEIVVTAQRREQSMQDVPIAVTAVTQETLQANRITTVNDLSAIAPGVTVKPSAGGWAKVSRPIARTADRHALATRACRAQTFSMPSARNRSGTIETSASGDARTH